MVGGGGGGNLCVRGTPSRGREEGKENKVQQFWAEEVVFDPARVNSAPKYFQRYRYIFVYSSAKETWFINEEELRKRTPPMDDDERKDKTHSTVSRQLDVFIRET